MPAESVSELILGHTRTVREVFGSSRLYKLESYQREYAWTATQVEELINDLTGRFVTLQELHIPYSLTKT